MFLQFLLLFNQIRRQLIVNISEKVGHFGFLIFSAFAQRIDDLLSDVLSQGVVGLVGGGFDVFLFEVGGETEDGVVFL